MKLCATCQNKYPDDANFCPREECAGPDGPRRLVPIEPPPARYVPVSRLGGGPSGEVWQASDTQTGTAVAYKVLAPGVLPTPVSVDRVLRELRQLQRAGSSRIVKVLDFGKTPEGQVFVVSELTEGEPLDQVVARTGPFPLDRAKRVMAQIGEALLDAQKVGVIHRDLAAKNVLVSRDDDARIINFAVPRPTGDALLGVPEFMSPEQAEGRLIDQRSNTYSLGALFYLMLTGQPPFTGATPQATIEGVLKGELTPPSIKRGSGLTAEVDRVVLKALERSSSRRPLTMRQFLSDVAALIVTEGQPAAAPAGAAGARDSAFAKTIMFAGGTSEVQKLVAQAVAARAAAEGPAAPAGEGAAGASGATTPVAAARPAAGRETAGRPTETPSPGAPRPSHGAAVAATVMSMPITGPEGRSPGLPSGAPRGTETLPPVALTPGEAAVKFRETLWFKRGDVEQMVADARAKVAALADAKKAAESPEVAAPEPLPEDGKGLQERYDDDGTLTAADQKKFSLGSTGKSGRAVDEDDRVPGERMSDSEVLSEIGGGKRMLIIGVAAAIVVALIAVGAVMFRGKGHARDAAHATGPAPAAAPAPEKPPAPAEAPAKAAPPVAPSAAEEKEAAAPPPPARKPAVAHHHAVPKKKAAPAKKHR